MRVYKHVQYNHLKIILVYLTVFKASDKGWLATMTKVNM